MEITWEHFLRNLQEIQTLSNEIHDDWKTCKETNFFTENSTYLIKKTYKQSKLHDSLLVFEYHVVFDGSYSVPKLCFNVFKSDGSLLKLEECLNEFNFEETDLVLEILTQMDHPVLQRPYYCLHPCRTAELMDVIGATSKNPLVTWLSTIGPSVGLTMDNDYSKLT